MVHKISPKAPTADVTELLHKDHQKVRELFFDFTNTEDEKEKEQLVKQIITELFIHAKAEEEIVYSEVEELAEGEDIIKEAETEHRMVKYLMAELQGMKASEELFDAKVTVLCELVNHHVREEEKEMFKKLRESDVDLEELAEKVESRKEELKSKPLPKMTADLEIAEEATAKAKAVKSKKSA